MQNAEDNQPLVLILSCRLSPPDRVASALTQARALFAEARTEVVDGLLQDDARTADLFDAKRAAWLTKRAPTLREVAVYGTHRMAWERLLASGSGWALVLEDDFAVTDAAAFLRARGAVPGVLGTGAHIIKLFDYARLPHKAVALRRRSGGVDLLHWAKPMAGTVGYVISAEGARRLLARRRVFRPVDEDIRHFWEFGLKVWSLHPGVVTDGSAALGGSLLEGDRIRTRGRRRFWRSLRGITLNFYRQGTGFVMFLANSVQCRDAHLVRLDQPEPPRLVPVSRE